MLVSSPQVGSVHGTCVEIKGAGIFSFLGARDRHSVLLPQQCGVDCLGQVLCLFCVCSGTSGCVCSWALPPRASPGAPRPEGSLPCGTGILFPRASCSSIALGNSCCAAHLAGGSWFTVLEACVPQAVSGWGPPLGPVVLRYWVRGLGATVAPPQPHCEATTCCRVPPCCKPLMGRAAGGGGGAGNKELGISE